MTKKDITDAIARKTGVNNEVVKTIIDEAIDVISSCLSEGTPVYIRGLFTLSAVKRAPKYTRNITKGESQITPAHYAPHAKFSKEIQAKMRELPIN